MQVCTCKFVLVFVLASLYFLKSDIDWSGGGFEWTNSAQNMDWSRKRGEGKKQLPHSWGKEWL